MCPILPETFPVEAGFGDNALGMRRKSSGRISPNRSPHRLLQHGGKAVDEAK